MNIIFNDFPSVNYTEATVTAWLHDCLRFYDVSFTKLMYHFISDNELLRINKDFLNHNTFTDIITFDYSTEQCIEAEVFISKDRLQENAISNGQTIEKELLRLISHAILHCLGYKDSTDEEKQRMRRKEDELIQMFHVKH